MRRKLFIAFGLTLIFSCLAVAQVKNEKRRIGPGLTGPVRSVRIERASVSKKGNDYVEGPRVLAETILLDPQWRRLERRYHNTDGSVFKAHVIILDSDGDQIEVSENNGEGGLIRKIVYRYDNRKRLNLLADRNKRELRGGSTKLMAHCWLGLSIRGTATDSVSIGSNATQMVLFGRRKPSLASLMLRETG